MFKSSPPAATLGAKKKTWLSCYNRFARLIQVQVQAYREISECMVPASGEGDDVFTNRVLEHFKTYTGSAFRFAHCLSVLEAMPKFSGETEDAELTNAAAYSATKKDRPEGTMVAKRAKLADSVEAKKLKSIEDMTKTMAQVVSNLSTVADTMEAFKDHEYYFGLIKSLKDLGQTEEAMKYMDILKNLEPSKQRKSCGTARSVFSSAGVNNDVEHVSSPVIVINRNSSSPDLNKDLDDDDDKSFEV